MKCFICGRTTALIRESELEMAKITGKAHIDCQGHAEYGHVSSRAIAESEEVYKTGIVLAEAVSR